MGFLTGKRALIVGVASDRSIAWGIAEAMHREGAELAFTYANDKLKERVDTLAQSIGSKIILPLDVTIDAQVDAVFETLKREWGHLDIVIHAVAFAPREALAGSFAQSTTREAFAIAHDVSSYSLTALARGAAPLSTRARTPRGLVHAPQRAACCTARRSGAPAARRPQAPGRWRSRPRHSRWT